MCTYVGSYVGIPARYTAVGSTRDNGIFCEREQKKNNQKTINKIVYLSLTQLKWCIRQLVGISFQFIFCVNVFIFQLSIHIWNLYKCIFVSFGCCNNVYEIKLRRGHLDNIRISKKCIPIHMLYMIVYVLVKVMHCTMLKAQRDKNYTFVLVCNRSRRSTHTLSKI